MSASSQMIALPEPLMRQAALRAGSLGVSTEQWLETAVSERIRLEEQTAAFFAERAGKASGRSLSQILEKVGDNPPDPGDELEA